MKKYLQAVGIWVCIIPLAIINGGLRKNGNYLAWMPEINYNFEIYFK